MVGNIKSGYSFSQLERVEHVETKNEQQWFIYNFWLMGPGTRCFQYQWVPTANFWVQNTIFNDKSAILLHPGTRWNKTYAQKMQDAQVTKSLEQITQNVLFCNKMASSTASPLSDAAKYF